MNIKEESNNVQNQKTKFKVEENYMFYTSLILFGLVIMMLRNADLFAQNMLYTEDGAWLGMMYDKGFWYTLINAKSDYFVFGNLIVLKFCDIANYIFFGDDISRIPMFIAFGQYFVYIGLAVSVVICLRKRIDITTRIIIYLMIIFFPFGNFAGFFEIPGRVSNIGYIFFPLALCILVYRLDFKDTFSLKKLIIIDFLIYICATTNPVCYALMPVFFLIDFYEQYNKSKDNIKFRSFDEIKQSIGIFFKERHMRSWIVLAIAMFISLAYCIFILPSRDSTADVETVLTIEIFVEWMVHSLVYPLIFPLYSKLTFMRASIILVAIFIFVFGGLFFMEKGKRRNFAIITTIFTFVYIISTIMGRSRLYSQVRNYQNIFPERYFYSQNIMALIMFFTILLSFRSAAKRKVVILLTCTPILIMYVLSFQQLFYANGNIDLSKSFSARVAQENLTVLDNGFRIIPIEFKGWYITIPEDKYVATLQRKRKAGKQELSNINDENWIGGVSTANNILLFPNNNIYKLKLLQNTPKIISTGEYSASIIKVENKGAYIWVYIDESADKMKFQYPAEITIE